MTQIHDIEPAQINPILANIDMEEFKDMNDIELQKQLKRLNRFRENDQEDKSTEKLLHDLHVHRIELEMQNRELRQAYQQLEETRDRYLELYEFAPVGYLTFNSYGQILEVNLTGATMLDRERSRIIGYPFLPFLVPGESRIFREHLRKTFQGVNRITSELRLSTGEHGILDVRLSSLAIRSDNGQATGCRTVMIDISEQKRAEHEKQKLYNELEQKVEIRTSELEKVNNALKEEIIEHKRTEEELRNHKEALAQAQRMTQHGNWFWNINSGEVFWSDEVYHLFGLNPDEPPTYDTYLSAVHPEDRNAVAAAIKDVIHNKSSYNFYHRIVMPNGTVRIIHAKAKAEFNDAGERIRVAGSIHDVTEQKQTEAELRQAAAVFENTSEGVIICDKDTSIIAVNKAFTEITGYLPEDVIGKQPHILSSGRQNTEFYKKMWSTLETNNRWRGEMWNRRKNGEVYPAWESISVIQDDQNRIINYVAVFSDISMIKEAQERLDYLAHHDALTGLPNRLFFLAALDKALDRAKRHEERLALLFLDLDRFKIINDTLGHDYGDELLKVIAQRLKQCVRAEDTVSRLGGDEFTIILDEISHSEDAAILAEKIENSINETIVIRGKEFNTSASIGISIYPDDAKDSSELLRTADTAMYRAKETLVSKYEFFTPELSTRALEHSILENALHGAMDRNEFILHYQPVIRADSGKIVGVEALIRWQHPELGMVYPNKFIPIAEETGLIRPLGDWVLRTACAQAKIWRDAGIPSIHLGINISIKQLMQDDIFLERIIEVLDETGLDPEHLKLEITENDLQTAQKIINILQRLKSLGVRLAIDDFGIGYSSLNSLKWLPVDSLKIDQSFIHDIPNDPHSETIASTIIAMGHTLGLKVVGEGVHNMDQLRFLQMQSCDEIQGNLYCQAVSGNNMLKILKEKKNLVL